MTIVDIVKQAFQFALTRRSLWLFGFFVGIASGGSSNGGGGGGGNGSAAGAAAGAAGAGLLTFFAANVVLIVSLVLAAIVAGVVMRYVGEAALIEGVVRARRGTDMTTREGFRAGWAHWGVIVRIALLYLAGTVGGVAVLAAPCVLAFQLMGPVAGIALAIPAAIVAVPWLVTLSLVQAFAWRIAVLEDRHALDAVRKARLFLHGRLVHGLKLIVATFVGTAAFGLAGALVIAPVALLIMALIPVLDVRPVVVIACLVLLPVLCVLTAMIGTFRSSIWTLGYVTQVES
jgi:hypothetical protein